MLARLTTLLALAVVPAAAQTALDYDAALRAALIAQGCAFDAAGTRSEAQFARQLSRTLGVPAAEISDRRGPHHAALARVVAEMAERGLLAVDGTRMALTDCRP